jgi:outer membrane murein-binding lipoprotein Lpp
MNKLWLLLLIPILVGLACVDSGGGDATNSLATQIATLTAKDASLQSSIDSTRSELNQKASKSEIDDVNRKINNLPQGGSTPADMATKAIVDQKIADAISALKADQAWIKTTGGGGGGNNDTPYGDVLASNGDLELYLEKDVDEELYVEHTTAKSFFLSVKNKGTAGAYYRLNANFDLAGDVSTIALTDAVLTCENSSMVTMARSTTMPGTVSGLAFVSQQSGGGTKIWIGKNSTVDLILVLKVTYNQVPTAVSGKLWTWDFSIRQIN